MIKASRSNRVQLLLVFLIILMLSGCALTRGRPIDVATLDQLEEGVTTENEVTLLFGEPLNRETNDSGQTILTYDYTALDPNAAYYIPIINVASGTFLVFKQSLAILLNKQGTVAKYVYHESDDRKIHYRHGYTRDVFKLYQEEVEFEEEQSGK